MPLRLSLDSDLGDAAEETIVLARALDLGDATEATLRVGIASVDLRNPGTTGFVFEVRPVFLAENGVNDYVGDPVASINVQEVVEGTLLLDSLAGGFGGQVQVSIRCAQPISGPMSLVAYVDVVAKS